MGNAVSRVTQAILPGERSRKRRFSGHEYDGSSEAVDAGQPPRKRVKGPTASAFVYKTYFIEGIDSDIVVEALGRCWKLHKTFLLQSPYFDALFSGRWDNPSCSSGTVLLELPDPTITERALDIVFGSLYSDEALSLSGEDCVPVYAASHFLQLPSIQEEACCFMVDHVSSETILPYLSAVERYENSETRQELFQWLLNNFFQIVEENTQILRQFDAPLLTSIISHSDLVVCQTEFSLYIILLVWLYLKLHPRSPIKQFRDLHQKTKEWLKKKTGSKILLTSRGSPFAEPFKHLRIEYLILHKLDVDHLMDDKVLSVNAVQAAAAKNWFQTLRAYNQDEPSDQETFANLPEEDFLRASLRCARVVRLGESSWRWTGFHFGMDVIVTLTKKVTGHWPNSSYGVSLKVTDCFNPEESPRKKRPFRFRLRFAAVRSCVILPYPHQFVGHASVQGSFEFTWSGTLGSQFAPSVLISANFLVARPSPNPGDILEGKGGDEEESNGDTDSET